MFKGDHQAWLSTNTICTLRTFFPLDLLKDIDGLAEEYLKNVRGMSPEKRTQKLSTIDNKFSKSREYGDDKVQLAMQTYEMVS